jgi:hypothetical protein
MFRKAKFIISFARSSCLVLDNSAGTIAREIWCTKQEFSADVIPPWVSMLIYGLGDEQ